MKKNKCKIKVSRGAILTFFAFLGVGLLITNGYLITKAWQLPTEAPPGGNVAAPLNSGAVEQTKTGKLNINSDLNINGKLCIKGNCQAGWVDPVTSQTQLYSAGHDSAYGDWTDVYTRGGAYTYPTLEFQNVVSKISVDSANVYATNWFMMGYNYITPPFGSQIKILIESGDDAPVFDNYNDTYLHNPSDNIWMCSYIDMSGNPINYTNDITSCRKCFTGISGVCSSKVSVWAQNYTSNKEGRLVLEVRYGPAGNTKSEADACTIRSYLGLGGNFNSIASWGDYHVTKLWNTAYTTITSAGQSANCIGSSAPVKWSIIEGRFIVVPIEDGRDTINSYVSSGANAHYSVKSVGISQIQYIQ